MANARLLYKKISLSLQVDRLPLPARLLFTWLIPPADDEGRIKGDPKYVKATVVPLTNWSTKLIRKYLEMMNDCSLIHYWQENHEWFIEFIKWEEYQHIRKDRFEPSKLPSFNKVKDNHLSTKRQPGGNQNTTKEKISESNSREINKSDNKNVADKKTFRETAEILNPNLYRPQNASEAAALEAWRKLEPNNNKAFYTTYLSCSKRGLPPSYFFTFVSEIRQSKCDNPGAVFNSKAKAYFNKKTSTNG